MHKMYLNEIDISNHREKIRDIIDMLMCDEKDRNHKLYKHIEEEMYEMAYGKKISEDIAKIWVDNMKPIGRYWNMQQTTDAMNNLGYNHDKIDFFVVANMMRNDYNDLTQSDDVLALKLAHDWLDDEDAKDCKLYENWKHVIKKD